MKLYFCLFFVFYFLSASGQQHSLSLNYKSALSYFSNQRQSFQESYFTSKKGRSTLTSSVGIFYRYRPLGKIAFTTGVEYARQGQNILFNNSYPGNHDVTFKVELAYIRIPLLLNYMLYQTKKLELSLYSGVSVGFATRRYDNYQAIIYENILLPPAENRYKKQDWAMPIGIDFRTNLTKRTFVTFGAAYELGLTNTFSENPASRFGVLSQFEHSRQSRLALNAGVGFNFK
jgi:hypothetical protein